MLDHNEFLGKKPGLWLNRWVLVTDHGGFLGRWLAARLSALGADLVGASRLRPSSRGLYWRAGLCRPFLQMLDAVEAHLALARALRVEPRRFARSWSLGPLDPEASGTALAAASGIAPPPAHRRPSRRLESS